MHLVTFHVLSSLQCWGKTVDLSKLDNGSVNLYIEERQGFDYYKFKVRVGQMDSLKYRYFLVLIFSMLHVVFE